MSRVTTLVPEESPAVAPAKPEPAVDKHGTMASKILAKTRVKRKLYDRPRTQLKYFNGRAARRSNFAEGTAVPTATAPHAANAAAAEPPSTRMAIAPVDTGGAARVR